MMFKIRDKKTGLFSSGGYRPNWSERGKVWHGRGPAILSLLCYDSSNRVPIERIEVAEFEIVEKSTYSAVELLRESRERKTKKNASRVEWAEKWQRERDEAAFEELRVRLGK